MTTQYFDLTGRVALVTGGRQGLGFAMAQGLAEAGARVWLGARDRNQAQEAAARLQCAGISVEPIAFDVTNEDAADEAISTLVKREGRLDILVNNAATRLRRALDDVSVDDFRAHLDINLAAQFAVARRGAREMARHHWGRLIMVSSLAATHGVRDNAAYCAGKAGVEGLMRSLACQYGSSGITCNAISPGKFATEINAEALSRPHAQHQIEERCPLRRHGRPADIVGPCLFLASEASTYVTGQVLTVDGGYSIQM